MVRAARVICSGALAALLGGCANLPPVGTDVATPGMPNPELALQHSMATVQTALYQLNGLYARPAVAQRPIMPAELNRPISLAWHGPLDAGVQALAARVGYRMYLWAPQNSRPLIVWVNVSNVTALEAFQALGRAAGRDATVYVDPQHQQVQVVHHV